MKFPKIFFGLIFSFVSSNISYFVLKVDHALTSEPKFMLLPNPYDPAYQDHFVIVDDGARVSYRP